MKCGIIQSRGIGDIIIALPIAKYYHDRGWEVHWPIEASFMPSFGTAADYVHFMPFEVSNPDDAFVAAPLRLLKPLNCERIMPLYSYLSGGYESLCDETLSKSLKFDEYKYARAEVPFKEKWNLSVRRQHEREKALFDKLVKNERYIVCQSRCSQFDSKIDISGIPPEIQRIEITEETDNIFDWLLILEKASALILIDSCFANLVEQLGIPVPKLFLFRSETNFTPVLQNGWCHSAAQLSARMKESLKRGSA